LKNEFTRVPIVNHKQHTATMGVYDFFRGKCPACDRNVDEILEDGIWEVCGDIQTKWFSYPIPGECFRDFLPGTHLPGTLPFVYTPIGETVCCQVEIDAVCYGTLLCGYRVSSKQDDKKEENEEENEEETGPENNVKELQETGFMPQYDKERYGDVSHKIYNMRRDV
jgi:hypothetical protein